MNKRKSRYFLRLLFNTLAGYLIACALIAGILSILVLSNVGIESWEIIIIVTGALLISVIVSTLLTYLSMKKENKLVAEIDETLDKISNGDFNVRLNLTEHDPYLDKTISKFNSVIEELNSVTILKNDFIRNFSHEFKTPISSIKGFSELLYRNKNISEEEKEKYCRIINEESSRLANLANMTLLLGKFDAQNIVVDKETFFVDEQIEECSLLLFHEVEKKSLNVQIDLQHFSVYGSKELLKELWLNLFSNAVKYTEQNGSISVYSDETPTEYRISFEDNGIGIDDAAIKNIFNAYYQENTSRTSGGIGLGLTICKRITELHGWIISVKSEKGKGSVFSVIIPRI